MNDDRKYVLRFTRVSRPHTYYTGKTPTTKIWEAKIFDAAKDVYNKRKWAQTARHTQIIKTTDKELFKARLAG